MTTFNISRFKNIESKTYECEIITPMFLAGANQKQAELRTQSIKGALRFWWRAIYGGNNIEDMKKREAEIFGSTEEKSRVIIKIDGLHSVEAIQNLPRGTTFSVHNHPVGIIHYLSYGTHEYQRGNGNQFIRPHIENGTQFKITLQTSNQYWNEVSNSFSAMIKYGGLGSRSRNGLGSITCGEITFNDVFNGNIKDYTAFSESAYIQYFENHGTWDAALSEIGLKYRDARLSLENRHQFTKRALIAKPIEARGERIPDDIRHGRQSKSYFLHVAKLQNNQYRGQILFLPNSTEREYTQVHQEMKAIIQGGAI